MTLFLAFLISSIVMEISRPSLFQPAFMLQSWYRNDMEVKKSIEKLENTTQEMKDQMNQLGKLHQSMDRKLSVLTENPRQEGGQLKLTSFLFYFTAERNQRLPYIQENIPEMEKTQKELIWETLSETFPLLSNLLTECFMKAQKAPSI